MDVIDREGLGRAILDVIVVNLSPSQLVGTVALGSYEPNEDIFRPLFLPGANAAIEDCASIVAFYAAKAEGAAPLILCMLNRSEQAGINAQYQNEFNESRDVLLGELAAAGCTNNVLVSGSAGFRWERDFLIH